MIFQLKIVKQFYILVTGNAIIEKDTHCYISIIIEIIDDIVNFGLQIMTFSVHYVIILTATIEKSK